MNFHNKDTDKLVEALLTLKNSEEMYDFLEDICTVKEILDMGQRLSVAYMLSEKMNYQHIALKTGASSATISRVNKCLVYGNGYKKAIENTVKNND